jgi:hypothetical protein
MLMNCPGLVGKNRVIFVAFNVAEGIETGEK